MTNVGSGCTPVRVSQIAPADWLGETNSLDSSPEPWRARTLTAPPRADSRRTWLSKRVALGGVPNVTWTIRSRRSDMPVVRPHEPRSRRRGGALDVSVLTYGTSQSEISPRPPVAWRRTNATRSRHCDGQASSSFDDEKPSRLSSSPTSA